MLETFKDFCQESGLPPAPTNLLINVFLSPYEIFCLFSVLYNVAAAFVRLIDCLFRVLHKIVKTTTSSTSKKYLYSLLYNSIKVAIFPRGIC